jgi:hypothetical protein
MNLHPFMRAYSLFETVGGRQPDLFDSWRGAVQAALRILSNATPVA